MNPETEPIKEVISKRRLTNMQILLILFFVMILCSLSLGIYYQAGQREDARSATDMMATNDAKANPDEKIMNDKKSADSISVTPDKKQLIMEGAVTAALHNGYKTMPITIKGETYIADISDTEESRQLGLSGRAWIGGNAQGSLAPESTSDGAQIRRAMLFVFDKDEKYGFWMHEMKFSIDILWLDKNKKIVHIAANAAPESYPKVFMPDAKSKYVIELEAGESAKLGIQVGDSVGF